MTSRGMASALGLGLALVLFALGCQRAQRYPAARDVPGSGADKVSSDMGYGWLEGEPPPALPIVFVAADTHPDEWQRLTEFWTTFPPPALGLRTIHVGQAPLAAALSLVAADQAESIRIKVPLGLPDPTPVIPAANPPTYSKWLLGRELFFDSQWLTDHRLLSCASCHNPKTGYTSKDRQTLDELGISARMNAPSLINCVYNRTQFWDGRVVSLEEVVQRQLQDEFAETGTEVGRDKYLTTHSFSGIIPRLKQQPKMVQRFKAVFGIDEPTTDAAAKALATYLRTILAGNSIYDKAQQAAGKDGKPLAKHYEPLLTDAALQRLGRPLEKAKDVADELALGRELFFAKRCDQCHSGWNFTDNGFHNIGIRESAEIIIRGDEPGRFAQLPYGLKDKYMIGAFKTPTLRNLPRTGPYFHDGSAASLEEVVGYFNKKVVGGPLNKYLAPELVDDATTFGGRSLNLDEKGVRAIAVFLRSLDGEAVPAVVSSQ